jgi:hypothetical protein
LGPAATIPRSLCPVERMRSAAQERSGSEWSR